MPWLLAVLRRLVRWAERRVERPTGWMALIYERETERTREWFPSGFTRRGPGPVFYRLRVYHAPYNGYGCGDWRWAVGGDCNLPPYHRAGYAETAAEAMRLADEAFGAILEREGKP